MKKAIALALAGPLALLLAGCDTSTVTTTVSNIEAQVQADTALVCEFVPTAATIAALIPPAAVVVPEAASIANAICNAIKAAPPVVTQSARLRSLKAGMAVNVAVVQVPGVGAVPISGQFVK